MKNSKSHPTAQAARKNERLLCPICERKFQRRARQHRFCSSRCMRKANYASRVSAEWRFGASKKEINGLQTSKRWSSICIRGPRHVIQVEVVGGREWKEVFSSSGVRSLESRVRQRALVETDDNWRDWQAEEDVPPTAPAFKEVAP
jgi:hypothetical protein